MIRITAAYPRKVLQLRGAAAGRYLYQEDVTPYGCDPQEVKPVSSDYMIAQIHGAIMIAIASQLDNPVRYFTTRGNNFDLVAHRFTKAALRHCDLFGG